MDILVVIIVAIVCLGAGIVAGYFFAQARSQPAALADHQALAVRTATAEAEARAAHAELGRQGELHKELAASARTELAQREDRERRDQAVLRALDPVRDALQNMQRKVDELEKERHSQFGSLAEQLRRAQESDEALRATTESLAGALRSGATRGVWGETQLRRVVEAAGLTRYVDFDTQTSIHSDAGAGRPDMVIRLPGNKSLAVDAKVPLDAFLEASAIPVTAQGEEGARRADLLAKHSRAVRVHIDALAKKSYWTGLESSPEFVICFLPSESLLSAALEEDPALLEYAFGRRVAVASPVNLWAVLKTIAYTWTQQDVTQEARRLFDLGTELYNRLGSLAGHADDLRRALERTVDSYNKFAGSLESRVLVTARKFPGIDQTKLDALQPAAPIDTATRRFTASELLESSQPPAPHEANALHETADIGALRDRLEDESVS